MNEVLVLLEQMSKRLDALENTVNNTLIAGLKQAANTYIDNENFDKFNTTYGASIAEVAPSLSIINGEDFDAARSLYDKIKSLEGYGTDDFDEASVVAETINELKNKLSALKNGAPVKVNVDAEVSDEPDEEQLMAELKGIK